MSIIKYAIIFVTAAMLSAAGGGEPAGHSWQYYYEKAQREYNGEMLDYAILNLQRCLDVHPACFQAANLMALVYVRKNLKDRAVEYYNISLGINERQPDIHYAIGGLYEFFAERELAFRHYARAVELEPDHVRAHCSLARIYYAKQDPLPARHHYETSYRLGMAAAGPLLAKAAEADRGGRLDEAAALYGRVIDEAPATTEAYLGQYEIYRRKNDYAKAAAVLERLAFVNPDCEKAYLLLGDVYFTRRLPGKRAHHLDRAVRCFKRALELNPNNYEACLSIADVYQFMGRGQDARAWKEKGMKIEDRVEARRASRGDK